MPPSLSSRAASVPSITLSITKHDGDRFHAASEAVSKCLEELEERSKGRDLVSTNAAPEMTNEATSRPLLDNIKTAHGSRLLDLLDDAVRSSRDPFLSSFLEHLASSRLSEEERRLSLVLFANMTKSAKLKLFFDTLQSKDATGLGRDQLISLFRIILTSISCCVPPLPSSNHNGTSKPLAAAGSPDSITQDRKRAKLNPDGNDHRETSNDNDEDVAAASSFDSAATLKDEDDAAALVQREIREVAAYAADSLMSYAAEHYNDAKIISFAVFGKWYSTNEAGEIAAWLELIHKSKWLKQQVKRDVVDQPIPRKQNKQGSPPSFSHDSRPVSLEQTTPTASPTLISFDFSGSGSPQPLVICISEDNIQALRHMVYKTGMIFCQAADMCKMLLRLASRPSTTTSHVNLTIKRATFRDAIGRFIIPPHAMHQCSVLEQDSFVAALMDVFACLEGSRPELAADEADLQEVATAICFFCAGSKSTKLSTAFELLDDKRLGYLTQAQLLRYLRAYLLSLTTLAYLQPISQHRQCMAMTPDRASALRDSVESGAKWTLSHFFDYLGISSPTSEQDHFSFESFASWYCSGGYNVAPWLELLDLNKVLALLNDQQAASPLPMTAPSIPQANRGFVTTARRPVQRDRMSSLRRHHAARRPSSDLTREEVLFSFPLANGRSLVVLRDDAIYVRDVVESLCLLTANPHTTWSALYNCVAKRRKAEKGEGAMYVNQATFVDGVTDAISNGNRKRPLKENDPTHSVSEILANFFQCFDIDQADQVALDELMGGLALLCGGKKSLKLAFAFGIFDTRPGMNRKKPCDGVVHSLSGEDLFLFLRSVLIVLFSCCRQSLDMSDDLVGRCITDTANLICNDVMRHQWETKQMDRLNFDDFGQWYNDGGFERAPWLELLDLTKWVLVDDFEALPKQPSSDVISKIIASPRQSLRPLIRSPKPSPHGKTKDAYNNAPALPEDDIDASFFDDNNLMGMDSMDEDDMDMFLSADTDNTDQALKMAGSFSLSPKNARRQALPVPVPCSDPPLKFHLVTADKHGGYDMMFSHRRIVHLRRVLQESGLLELTIDMACSAFTAAGTVARDSELRISKQQFDTAMKNILTWKPTASAETRRCITGLLDATFGCFVRDGNTKPIATEIACGMTIFCQGKKSDKLEYAFDLLDQKARQKLSKRELIKYFQSFLTVLLGISVCRDLDSDPTVDILITFSGERFERAPINASRAAKAGAEWAASLIFRELSKPLNSYLTFDDFAAWYTAKGHVSMPWLELIDLKKWVLQV